ncbi:MAG: hypothetical protein IPM29_18385 [Planctomycetes bacterium]|nr:hypothetical protein [Planctomycetota bacterium]
MTAAGFATALLGWVGGGAVAAAVLALAVSAVQRVGGRTLSPGLRELLATLVLVRLATPGGLLPPALPWPGAGPVFSAAPLATSPGGVLGALALAWLAGLLAVLALALRGARTPAHARAPDATLLHEVAALARRHGLRPPRRVAVVQRGGDRQGAGPRLCGTGRPTLVIPLDWLARQRPAERDCALLHELVHLRRRDALRAGLTLPLLAAFWFHPAAWWAARRLRAARELGCDAEVVARLGGECDAYRRTLLATARDLLLAPARGAVGWISPASVLLERLAALGGAPVGQRRQLARLAALPIAALFACSLCEPTGPASPVAAVATAPVDQRPPPLDSLPGCFQLRYAVLSAMAAESPEGRRP